ncbi:MAG: HNH endonuclease [Thermoguttaceae bacterium]
MSPILQRPTLVLNRYWQPIRVATVARALVLLWNQTAQVVDPNDYRTYTWEDWAALRPRDGEDFIQAVRMRLRAPEVITLVECDRGPRTTVTFSRRNLFRRDRWACQYCGKRPSSDSLTIDHVIPRSRGGVSRWENCVLACAECNRQKANRTPAEAHMRLRRKPRAPKWSPLFAVQDHRIESWAKFISEAYWNIELED